jgi:hypothetical protein
MLGFDTLDWRADRLLVGDTVLLLGRKRRNAVEDVDGLIFVKSRRVLDQYAAALSRRPVAPGAHMLELGIHDGGSLAFWCEMLEPDRIAALDRATWGDSAHFRKYTARHPGRIVTHWETSQDDTEQLLQIVTDDLGGRIDFVIDDASHLLGPMRTSFTTLFPLLRPGALYAIEDWSWGKWPHLPADFPLPLAQEPSPFIAELVSATGNMALSFVGDQFAPTIAAIDISADLVVVERGPARREVATAFCEAL